MNKTVVLSLALVSAAGMRLGAAVDASDLLNNSPFVRAKAAPGQSGSESGQYVFRGVCVIGEDTLVNISDETAKKTYWIKTNETEGNIKVVSYDVNDKKVAIVVGSRDYTLELAKVKVPSAKDAKPAAAPQNTPDNKTRDLRIKRNRRNGAIPPPPFDINDPNLPPELRGPNGPWGHMKNNNQVHSRASGGSSPSEGSGGDSGSNSNTDGGTNSDSGNSSSTPPTTVPPPPPTFVPELPDSIRSQIQN